MDRTELRGLQAAVLAYTLWGLLTIYWKQLAGLDAIELIGWRVATAGVVMALIVSVLGHWAIVIGALRDPQLLRRIVVASFLLTVNWTTYVWAVVNDRVIETALGYFLAPLGTMTLGVLVLGETLTPLKRASMGCAGVAVIVLTISYGRMPWVALLLATTWSWYGLTKRRVPLDPIDSLTSELFVLFAPGGRARRPGLVPDRGHPEPGRRGRLGVPARHRRDHGAPAPAVRVRGATRAVHPPGADELPGTAHQLPAGLAGVRRGAPAHVAWPGSRSCGAHSCSSRSTSCDIDRGWALRFRCRSADIHVCAHCRCAKVADR